MFRGIAMDLGTHGTPRWCVFWVSFMPHNPRLDNRELKTQKHQQAQTKPQEKPALSSQRTRKGAA